MVGAPAVIVAMHSPSAPLSAVISYSHVRTLRPPTALFTIDTCSLNTEPKNFPQPEGQGVLPLATVDSPASQIVIGVVPATGSGSSATPPLPVSSPPLPAPPLAPMLPPELGLPPAGAPPLANAPPLATLPASPPDAPPLAAPSPTAPPLAPSSSGPVVCISRPGSSPGELHANAAQIRVSAAAWRERILVRDKSKSELLA